MSFLGLVVQKLRSCYLVREEYAVVLVTVSWVNPGIADKMNPTVARNMFQSDRLEVELAMVMVPDDESPRDTRMLVPIECNSESSFSGRK